MGEQEIGRHLDLVSKLKLKKLAKEVSESDNHLAKDVLVYVAKLNETLDKKEANKCDCENDFEYEDVDTSDYNYRTFD